MRRGHFLRFDALEARKLLTQAHVDTAHHPAVAVVTPVEIDGTLTVNINDSTQYQNADGSWTTSVPVSGQLGTMGIAHGTWYTTEDNYGNYMGPDELTLQFQKPKGSIVVDFDNQNSGKPKKIAPGVGYYEHTQKIVQGGGAYAKVKESGTIQLIVDSSKGSVDTLVLSTMSS